MKSLYQDSMARVRKLGKPHAFITMTCNPKWKEIQEALLPNQSPSSRPDIISRVFRMKLNELLDDISKRQVLGKPIGLIHVIEFQKRGLPHAHILLMLDPDDAPKTDDYDMFTVAELPNPETEPELYKIISEQMMHGPCGAEHPGSPCMVPCKDDPNKKVCSKNFPKPFNPTTEERDGLPNYRRRDDGDNKITADKKVIVNGQERIVKLDNRFVVPYNRCFCKKYQVGSFFYSSNFYDTSPFLLHHLLGPHKRRDVCFNKCHQVPLQVRLQGA